MAFLTLQLRRQHEHNAIAIMREAMRRRDHGTAARAVLIVLQVRHKAGPAPLHQTWWPMSAAVAWCMLCCVCRQRSADIALIHLTLAEHTPKVNEE